MTPHVDDLFWDNTKISAYKDCPRKYFLRHVMHWRSEGTATPLVFGGAWHAAMDVIWQDLPQQPIEVVALNAMTAFANKWEEEGLPSNLDTDQERAFAPRTPMIAAEMIPHYISQRHKIITSCIIVDIEKPFAVPLPSVPKAWYVGRLDKVIQHQGQILVIEHKTTALYRKEGPFQYDWTNGWYTDSQIKGYEFGGNMYYPENFGGVWVDGAMVHRTVHDGYKFIPVKHTIDLVSEWLGDTEQWVERINRDTILFDDFGHLAKGVFPKNENSCYGKYGGCAFLDICRTTSDIEKGQEVPQGYVFEPWEPFETLGLEKIIEEPA